MIPIVGEQYWWTVENNTYPCLSRTKYCNKVVEVVAIPNDRYCVKVRIIESSYRGELGLTFSTVPGCLYDLTTKIMEVL